MRLPDSIRIISSAFKHGVTTEQIYDCLYNPYCRPQLRKSQSDPTAILALGETEDEELFEIAYVLEPGNQGRVFHAMPMRESYRNLYKKKRRKK